MKKIKITRENIKEAMSVLGNASWVTEEESNVLWLTMTALYKLNKFDVISVEQMETIARKYDKHGYGDMMAWIGEYPLNWKMWNVDHFGRPLPQFVIRLCPSLCLAMQDVMFLFGVVKNHIWQLLTRRFYTTEGLKDWELKFLVDRVINKEAEQYFTPDPYEEHDESGPYGGAFRDEQDYVEWREGKGFCEFR